MTIKTSSDNHAENRVLDDAELDAVSGGSVTDLIIDPMVTSPRDPSTGLPVGKHH